MLRSQESNALGQVSSEEERNVDKGRLMTPRGAFSKSLVQAETLVFVDVDGVINVGIRDTETRSPLLLCEKNLAQSKQTPGKTSHIIRSVGRRQIGQGDEGTYARFATTSDSSDICPILAQRMAEIIVHAGPQVVMVLSSSWRKDSHQNRVLDLEAALSKYSGTSIKFEHRTKPGGDNPDKRVALIGDFIHDYTESRSASLGPLRVLVVDDFAATHPRDWQFPDAITSERNLEDHWRGRSAQPDETFVKLLHTYDEWKTDKGVPVQIGSGLTCAKVSEARRWLSGKADTWDM